MIAKFLVSAWTVAASNVCWIPVMSESSEKVATDLQYDIDEDEEEEESAEEEHEEEYEDLLEEEEEYHRPEDVDGE